MKEETHLQTLLRRYQVRKTARQKAAFFPYVQAVAHSAGYPCRIEEAGKRAISRNIIAGDPEQAKVIFTAHYDTCAESIWPNRAYPQNLALTLLAQMPLILMLFMTIIGTAIPKSIL